MVVEKFLEKYGFLKSFGGGGSPKAPPPPSPAPTQTSQDVVQESEYEKRKALLRGGRQSTILTQQANPSEQKTLLGQ